MKVNFTCFGHVLTDRITSGIKYGMTMHHIPQTFIRKPTACVDVVVFDSSCSWP